MTRRTLLKAALGTTAYMVCGSCALFAKKRDPDLTATPTGDEVRFSARSFPAIGQLGGSIVVEVSGMEDKVLVFRRPDGSLAALSMTCTHLGCDVAYKGDRDRIVCPCHGSMYDAQGDNLKGPARKPLKVFSVSETGDTVILRTG